jgi:hypothetical protein
MANLARGTPRGYTNITGATWLVASSNRTVSAISKQNPVRITTSTAHGYSTGDTVYFTGIGGGSSFQGLNTSGGTTKRYTITKISNTVFSLNGVNSSGWSSSYTASSGTVRKCLTSSCEVVVTSASNGLSDGELTYISNVSGTSSGGIGQSSITWLNGKIFTVADAASGSFTLSGTDGPDFSNSSGNSTYSSGGRSQCVENGCSYLYFQDSWFNYQMWPITNCVTERVAANQYDDTAPSTTVVGRNYTSSGADCGSQTIVPLTYDKTTLHNKVAALDVAGSTAGQIGLAWAWYAVSPNFSTLFTGNSTPASYTTPNLVKVVILMTDGAFNTGYCNGVLSKDYAVSFGWGSTSQINCNATNGNPFTQATALCDAIKAQNVVLYTVGFDMASESQTAKDFMASCATDSDHAYMADDGTALQEAFQDIANNIAALRIAS